MHSSSHRRRGPVSAPLARVGRICAWALLVVLLPAAVTGQDARTVVAAASQAMGANGLDSITYSGIAAVANFGQSRTISFGLASTTIRNYTRTIDFTQPASRVTGVATPPAVHGAPAPGPFEDVATAADRAWAQHLEIWLTPWGFLRGAAAAAPSVKSQKIDEVPYKVVTWSPAQKAPSGQSYRLVGYINDANMVDRVETWVEHPIFGDLHVENRYTNYQDFGGLKVPGRISQKRIGMEVFVAVINTARANPPDLGVLLRPSSPSLPAAARPAPVTSEKLAEGVYRIDCGYTALAVALRDFVVIIGGGGTEASGQAILAETKRVLPGKPIRYAVNTHPHFDHAAVLPPFAAEGITILTEDNNRYFLEQAMSAPRTLAGDALATSRRKPKVESIVDRPVLGDGARSIELHRLPKFEHSDGMLVAYLPKEKILFTADVDAASPALASLQLAVERHITAGPSNGAAP
jgi:glyoxylase-like metal-dependent hydrolase (beta-lactamase superfamily II)